VVPVAQHRRAPRLHHEGISLQIPPISYSKKCDVVQG
jgi:hypothetical protein